MALALLAPLWLARSQDFQTLQADSSTRGTQTARAQAQAEAKPVIGISCNATGSAAHISYVEAVEKAGGLPVIIPRIDTASLPALIERLDGLLLIGGEDIDPAIYGEEAIPEMGEIIGWRDTLDLALARLAFKRDIPVLGICRGIQVINVAFGGSLYQDLPSQLAGLTEKHSQKEPSEVGTHKIIINRNSALAAILPEAEYMVNSFHHQAVKRPAPGFEVEARTPQGVIEAIALCNPGHSTIRGVQFHPEKMIGQSDVLLPVFTAFIEEASH